MEKDGAGAIYDGGCHAAMGIMAGEGRGGPGAKLEIGAIGGAEGLASQRGNQKNAGGRQGSGHIGRLFDCQTRPCVHSSDVLLISRGVTLPRSLTQKSSSSTTNSLSLPLLFALFFLFHEIPPSCLPRYVLSCPAQANWSFVTDHAVPQVLHRKQECRRQEQLGGLAHPRLQSSNAPRPAPA